MGREAKCRCTWGGRSADVTALLESTEIILRGGMRARIPLSDIGAIRADAATLTFTVANETLTFELGAAEARAWAQNLSAPPPSLARKLGAGATQRARPASADLAVLRCDDARARVSRREGRRRLRASQRAPLHESVVTRTLARPRNIVRRWSVHRP